MRPIIEGVESKLPPEMLINRHELLAIIDYLKGTSDKKPLAIPKHRHGFWGHLSRREILRLIIESDALGLKIWRE